MLIGIESSDASLENAGDTTYMRELLKALAGIDQSYVYRLVAIRSHPFYAQLPDCFTFRQLPRPWSRLRYFTSLPYELWRHPVEVFHIPYILPVGFSGRSVVTIHDLHFEHYPLHYPPVDRWFLKCFVRRSASLTDQVVTGSEYSKRDLQARYGLASDKITVIPYGINSRFKPVSEAGRLRQVQEKYGIAGPFLLFIGRLADRRKNVDFVMKVYTALGREFIRDYQLVIVGKTEGRLPQALVAQGRALAPGRIVFTGFVADDDVATLMAAASVFVYPSLFEGFGLPPLEAMACGTPVISSNATSLPEVIGEAGVLLDPSSAEAWVDALQRILTDVELRQHLREQGLRHVTRYTWERCARQTLAVYESLGRSG